MRRRKRVCHGADQLAAAGAAIAALNPLKVYRITVEIWEPNRTAQQNARYLRILHRVCVKTGDDIRSLHEWCATNFLPMEVSTTNPDMLVRQKTSKLSISTFAEYVDQIEVWAQEILGGPIPD